MATITLDFGKGGANTASDALPSVARALRDIADDLGSLNNASFGTIAAANAVATAVADISAVAASNAAVTAVADADATYGQPEADLINDLKAKYNAAVTLINELKADAAETSALANDLKAKYNAAVTLINELKSDSVTPVTLLTVKG